jgi:hypothetical protein
MELHIQEQYLMQSVRKYFFIFLLFLANRFTNGGRVSAAVHDNLLQESPSRLNPNKVLRREKEGGAD